MSYRIFIGNDIDKLSDFIELYIFNKTEHINLFRTLKELKLLFPIIREGSLAMLSSSSPTSG